LKVKRKYFAYSFEKFGKHTDLTVYGVHEKGWNMIKIIFQEELMFW
jgi:hypothetical protein